WISGHSREDPAQLPTLDKPLDESGSAAEELTVRSEGQFPDTVGLQSVRSVEPQQGMVQVPIVGIAILHKIIAVIFPESLTKRIGALHRESVRDPLRHLNLQRVVRRTGRVAVENDLIELRVERKEILRKPAVPDETAAFPDRKSTRLNSSHQISSYADFCLKKKTGPTFISCPSATPAISRLTGRGLKNTVPPGSPRDCHQCLAGRPRARLQAWTSTRQRNRT